MTGKLAQGEPHAAGGEVGFAPAFQHDESPELGAEDRKFLVETGLVDPLPDGVPGGRADLEMVLVIEGGAQLVDLEFRGGLPDFQALGAGIHRRADVGAVHDPANLAVLVPMFSEIPNIPSQ